MRIGYFKQLQDWHWFGFHRFATCTYLTFGKFFVGWDKSNHRK